MADINTIIAEGRPPTADEVIAIAARLDEAERLLRERTSHEPTCRRVDPIWQDSRGECDCGQDEVEEFLGDDNRA